MRGTITARMSIIDEFFCRLISPLFYKFASTLSVRNKAVRQSRRMLSVASTYVIKNLYLINERVSRIK